MNEWTRWKKGEREKEQPSVLCKIRNIAEEPSTVTKKNRPKCARNCMPVKNIKLHHYCTTLFLLCSFAAGICAIFQHHITRAHIFKRNSDFFLSFYAAAAAVVVVDFFSLKKILHICCSILLFYLFILIFLHHFWVIWFYKLYLVGLFYSLAFCHSFIHSSPWLNHHFQAWICCSWCENHIWFAKMIAVQIQMSAEYQMTVSVCFALANVFVCTSTEGK